ncbi:hypothetical protein SEA_PARADIDDLES_206 [Streptomyces phage Paradiddles]|jgi:hypothetical protein|uniref:Uncharacterized protein n=2 Tax=Samistivirus TaxID=2560220 RepID=A0A222Z050_9CAUD|nr:hypothetical protein FDI36_gp087 [Streptomyces phage NootNoot]YP_009611157.1 hypothetical protein FDI37_gp088 [Streptomyces phage Paradiddles]ASR77434.1 hypothetical protein SEA_NOOTNOOT_211 [Streptomyces phage NootNoot]ASR77635.1 hypothetical protein SEA_PARADIDDLES_206 [Streptomyces phage Paradiddles]
MTYSEMRVDMRIRNLKTGLKATIATLEKGKFRIVDENGHVEDFDRYDAGEWEKIQ